MAAFRNRHSFPSRRPGSACSVTNRSTSASGRRRYAAVSARVKTSAWTGPLAPGDGAPVACVGCFVRGMVSPSFLPSPPALTTLLGDDGDLCLEAPWLWSQALSTSDDRLVQRVNNVV